MRFRWWHWCIAIVVFLGLSAAALALVIRLDGRRQWERHVADMRAQGRPASVSELLAMAPGGDPALQERFTSWAAAVPADLPADLTGPAWDAFVAGGAPPASVVAWYDKHAVVRTDGIALVRAGVIAGALGWLHRMPPPPHAVEHFWNLWGGTSTLLVTRFLAQQLLVASALEDDPLAALRDLDRLTGCIRHDTLVDAMSGMAVRAIADRAWLEAVARGRVGREAARAWIHPVPDEIAAVADGVRAERLCFATALAEALARSDGRGVAGSWTFAITGWAEAATLGKGWAAMEHALRSGSGTIAPVPRRPWLIMAPMSLGNAAHYAEAAILADAARRACRACAEIRFGGWRSAAQLPPEVRALLAPTPGRAGLVAAFAADRVAVAIDPGAPRPPLLGSPPPPPAASAAAVVRVHRASAEMPLPLRP